jgi:hypothetical protein
VSKWPKPFAGQVIRYSYLWKSEADKGREEGVKDRPCAIVLAAEDRDRKTFVAVLPVTHTPPGEHSVAVELPLETKRRIGLDDQRSWVVVDEYNWFRWPGPDLRPEINGDASTAAMGVLPPNLFNVVREQFIRLARSGLSARVRRTE